ncbi:MAG: dynamin family protein [Proteobacteria bacterium]|nr:dynamin family protein [Pseudomonadota bacterium]
METYNFLKEELVKVNRDIFSLLSDTKSIARMADDSFADWEKTCNGIRRQITEEIIRVAVVGPIKSGKSTFINSLFKGDYLKRGAGVVTSIVTRIRSGKLLNAKLLFKSWDEINADIEQALVLFPSLSWRSESDRFDIRRKKERIDLQQALDALGTEHLITRDARNVNSVLLTSYLKGYERVQAVILADNVTRHYRDGSFAEHRDFVGSETLAVYLKDVQLEINTGTIDSNIEIADCQGSDSSNPLHIAMIQDYLLTTHLILYVISSRTGLREADIRFLSMINKMGIMDNTLFVVNCDFSEHESLVELNALIAKVKEELALIKTDPEIFPISALFNLFKAQPEHLSPKDGLRLEQWEKESALTVFSDQETERFKSYVYQKLTRERYALLLKNHLERLGVIAAGIDQWIYINQNLLSRDADSAGEIISKVAQHQESVKRMKTVIKNTLDGAVQKMQQKLKSDVDRFFDIRSGKVIKDVVEYIRSYRVSYDEYGENLKSTGFSNALYLIFQDFKHALDTYMAETVNPEVIRFVRTEELWIKNHLDSIADPYHLMVQDALSDYNQMMKSFGIINRAQAWQKRIRLPDLESIKNQMGLSLPPAVASLRYTAKIKTEAVLRLGFYTVVKLFKRLLKKPIQGKEEVLALEDGVLRMKRETEKSIIFLFKDYRENIKFQYFLKLIEAVSNNLYEALLDRFQAYVTDLSNMVELVSQKRFDKEQASEILKEMELTARQINQRIDAVREKIETIN